jgi:16S rRNA C1402 (ribose-2'-O) methylase RsmI
MFEQYFHGSVDEVQEAIKNKKIPLKGEFVVCFIPKND